MALSQRWVINAVGTRVGGVGAHASLTEWELGLRWLLPASRLRPYLLAGVGLERSRAAGIARDDWGFTFGGGLEAGSGFVQPFVEARGFKDGAVAGFFWGGIRFKLGSRLIRGEAP